MNMSYEERYRSGEIPWDYGMPDFNLIHLVSQRPVMACAALDVGCGTGDNSIWLAEKGFDVSGCDLSETAIELAREKAIVAGVECKFSVVDFLVDSIAGSPFGFIFDRGCLHSISDDVGRKKYAENVSACMEENGLWMSLVGNADEPVREVGPPRLTAGELVSVVEPWFEIISINSGYFSSNQPDPPWAWICLMQKRDVQ